MVDRSSSFKLNFIPVVHQVNDWQKCMRAYCCPTARLVLDDALCLYNALLRLLLTVLRNIEQVKSGTSSA